MVGNVAHQRAFRALFSYDGVFGRFSVNSVAKTSPSPIMTN